MNDQNITTSSAPAEVDFDKVNEIKILSGRPENIQSNGVTEPAKPKQEEEEGEEEEDDINDKANQEGEEEKEEDQRGQGNAGQEDEQEEDDDGFELDEDQVDDLISQKFGMPASEIQSILAQHNDLLAKSNSPQFPSEKHQKAYEFITKYAGDDWGAGVERFAKLQSLEVEKMDHKSAMRELFYQQNSELSREDADALFEHEFNQKYGAIEDERIAQTKQSIDAKQAKQELLKMQAETQTVKSEEDIKQHETAYANYKKGVEDSFADFDQITLENDDDPESAFNFEIENKNEIREAMTDISKLIQKFGWMDEKGNWNFDAMKVDAAMIINKEKMFQSYYQHGQEVAKEKLLREIGNKTPKERKQVHNNRPGPSTKDEALEESIMNHPALKKNM